MTRYTDGCRPGGTVAFWEIAGADHFFIPTAEFERVVTDYFESHPKE